MKLPTQTGSVLRRGTCVPARGGLTPSENATDHVKCVVSGHVPHDDQDDSLGAGNQGSHGGTRCCPPGYTYRQFIDAYGNTYYDCADTASGGVNDFRSSPAIHK
jgi:hypothetical protein